MLGKSSYFFLVTWHGGSCQEMCGTILWVCQQDDSTTLFQRRRMKSVGELSKVCSQIVLKCLYLARIGWPDILRQRTNLHDRSLNGPKLVTNDCLVWSFLIIHVTTNNVDWECFKTPILKGILRIQNLHQVEHYAFSEGIRLFQSVGCVRNKLQFRTVQKNQKSFLWTQDRGWTVFPYLICGIWSSQFCTETRIRVINNGETCVRTYVRFVQHLTNFKNERNLMEWLMIWTMFILFPQTSILLVRKLCCMCLTTTKQWSRWS